MPGKAHGFGNTPKPETYDIWARAYPKVRELLAGDIGLVDNFLDKFLTCNRCHYEAFRSISFRIPFEGKARIARSKKMMMLIDALAFDVFLGTQTPNADKWKAFVYLKAKHERKALVEKKPTEKPKPAEPKWTGVEVTQSKKGPNGATA